MTYRPRDPERQRRFAGRRSRYSRNLRLEVLERRDLLTHAPFLETPLLNQIVPTDGSGLTIGIDGGDLDGDALTISVVSDDPDIDVFMPQGNRYAVMQFTDPDGTPIGDIVVQLFETRGGQAAARFIQLSTTGFDAQGQVDPNAPPFYTNVPVHRVIPGFAVQSGDKQNGNGTGGSPLGPFPDEFDLQEQLRFSGPGVLAMANAGPDSNDSQWFITDGPTPDLNFDSGNSSAHMIFGQVISGFNTTFKDLIRSETIADSGEQTRNPPVLAAVDIVHSDQDATVTLTAGANWDGQAQLTVQLRDPSGNLFEQIVELRTRAHLGQRPSIQTSDVFLAYGETGDLPSTMDPEGLEVDVELLYQRDAQNSLPRSVHIDNASGEITVTAEGFAGLFPALVTTHERGYSGFLPTPTSQLVNLLTQLPGEPRAVARVAQTTSRSFASALEGNLLYVADGNAGIAVYDLSDPGNPVFRGQLNVGSEVRDIAVIGDSAFVAAMGGGMISLDISDPQSMFIRDQLETDEFGGTGIVLTVDLAVQGGIAYLANFQGGVATVDISNPDQLVIRDTLVQVRPGVVIQQAVGVAVSGNYMYVTDRAGGVVTIDVVDPDALRFVSGAATGSSAPNGPFGIDVESDHLFVADLTVGLIVFDLSDPESPQQVDRLSQSAFQVDVMGSTAVVSTSDDRFLFIDVSDPSDVAISSQFTIPGGAGRALVDDSLFALAGGTSGVVVLDRSPPTVTSHFAQGVLRVVASHDLNITIGVSNGNVQVNNSDPNGIPLPSDQITAIEVMGGPGDTVIDLSAVDPTGFPNLTTVEIHGGSGFDTITGSSLADTIFAGPGADQIEGGLGNDIVFAGSGDDVLLWNEADGSDQLDGGTGHNTVGVTTAQATNDIQISATSTEWTISRVSNPFSLTLKNLDAVLMTLGDGDDSVQVSDLSAVARATLLHIDAGAGNDTLDARVPVPKLVDLVFDAGPGDDLLLAPVGHFHLDGGPGHDRLRPHLTGHLDLSLIAADHLAGINQIDVTGSGSQSVRLTSTDVVRISDADDTVTLRRGVEDMWIASGWAAQSTEVLNNERFFVFTQGTATLRVLQPGSPWQNPLNRYDVNADGFVQPADVLRVINYLNANPGNPTPPAAVNPTALMDTTGDRLFSPLDVLLVINLLNGQSGGEGEHGKASILEPSELVTDHTPWWAVAWPFASDYDWHNDTDKRRRMRW